MKRVYTLRERQAIIIRHLAEKGRVEIKALMNEFGISEVSIRKDLATLEAKQLLIRVKGGAVNISQLPESYDLPIENKSKQHLEEKMRIGELAASMVNDGETILLDAGSTTMEVAKNLKDRKNLTIITNSLRIALYLASLDKFNTIVLGGKLRSLSESTVGMVADNDMKNFYCDKLFLGVDSFNIEKGISTPNLEEAGLNQTMIASARQVIAVFDSSKFGRRSLAFISSIENLDDIITDSNIPAEYKDFIERSGARLHIV